ncbi:MULTISPECIES: GNAT family N-acetyltransferase [Lactiplantibacillus]|jgi:RimJ/RimL family protein N-acetyltransferase|uniref:N-acetyltransferase n=3 Tax=Lactiplantibacillus pentosus TaxID=1589 RepID=A0A241RMA9_LACPE|nr:MULTISPECIES: GNAT family N-acetyltransferase [Lactiplantibacillus]MCH4130070.1 GNAT family N-acetyltransferase [Lactiplantibacillus sp.]BBM20941.1 acetyltransferase, GNAT family [Lactiplantibacillus plantarum]ASG79154.1 N-acetyltransferase [Lactiplantibacillus pentosus]AUI79532.1 GNAT family N-acetyltransferase [Lactiplantibacillus pentosus]AYJ41124.1 GNAT family N-acetyltransferase [Lactiplantibacillus pentosus]
MAEEVVDVRPAEVTDAAQLLALLAQLGRESNTFTVDDGIEELSETDEAEQIERISGTTTNVIFVAVLGDRLIGVSTVQASTDFSAAQGEVGVAVLKEFWGMGLGTALVEEILDWARNYSSLERLVLTVQLRNTRAAKLYQHLGFENCTATSYEVVDPTGQRVAAIDMSLWV